jgi:hypothetical protein
VGPMLPHRITIYTIRCNFPSTQREHSFPLVFGVDYTCQGLRARFSSLNWDKFRLEPSGRPDLGQKRGQDVEKLENKTHSPGFENS